MGHSIRIRGMRRRRRRFGLTDLTYRKGVIMTTETLAFGCVLDEALCHPPLFDLSIFILHTVAESR